MDESVAPGEGAAAYLHRVVDAKLAAVGAEATADVGGLLVADTSVVVDDEILGKPADAREAAEMLRRLVGRAHVVMTRYAIARPGPERVSARTVETRVVMRGASADEIARYAATGEGFDKAGGYAIQGIGAFLVERIEGSYSNVVGLPQCEVVRDLLDAGLLHGFP